MTDADLDALIQKAAAFNNAHGITGILAVEGNQVCQILEGENEATQELFRSIRRDPRHSGVTELVNHPVDAKSFDDWGMVRRPMIEMVTTAFAA